MANTDYGAIPLTLATAVSQALNHRLGVSTGFKPSEWADNINLLVKPAEKTASGSIAHFTDGLDTPLVNGKFGITAYQDGTGTPSPSNVRAIHGWTGMDISRCKDNLIPMPYEIPSGYDLGGNITLTYDSSGVFYINGVGTGSGGSWGYVDVVSFKLPTTQCVISVSQDSNNTRVWLLKDGTNIKSYAIGDNPYVFNAEGTSTYTMRIRASKSSTFNNEVIKVKIELGSSATAYSAYNGTTYPLTWQNECFGGYIDYKRGKKVTTHVKVNLSDLTWVYQLSYSRFNCTDLQGVIKAPANNSTAITGALCSLFGIDASNNTASSSYDNIIGVSSTGNIQIRDTSLNGDLDLLDTLLQNSAFVYPLETPIEEDIILPIISVLDGENNVWNTCGDSEVTYRANPS